MGYRHLRTARHSRDPHPSRILPLGPPQRRYIPTREPIEGRLGVNPHGRIYEVEHVAGLPLANAGPGGAEYQHLVGYWEIPGMRTLDFVLKESMQEIDA